MATELRVQGPRRRLEPAFLLAVVVAILSPPMVLLGVTYWQAFRSAESMLQHTVDGSVRYVERLLDQAEVTLQQFVAETVDPTGDDLQRRLTRLVYNDSRFREAGIIDAAGNLILTNFGPLEPPIPISPAERTDPADRRLQVVGLIRTQVMRDESVIIGLPTAEGGEVNLLVDPAVLTAPLSGSEFVPAGFVALTTPDRRLLAAVGRPPLHDDRLLAGGGEWCVRREAVSSYREVHAAAAVCSDWILRDWRRNMLLIGLVSLCCSLLLFVTLYRLFRCSLGLDYDLSLGLKKGEFFVVYQPIVDFVTGRTAGVEALLRWRHPNHGTIPPDVFVPLAEQTGQIGLLTGWVLKTAAAELSPISTRFPNLWISFNTPLSLIESGDIVQLLDGGVSGTRLPRRNVRLEITERHLHQYGDGAVRAGMADLVRRGVGVGLDDFGTGSCGLSHLLSFDLSYLKIDKSFVREIGRDSRAAAVLDTLLDMGRRLRLSVIGEGIETIAQRSYLIAADVRFGQGFLLATPMPADRLLAFLEEEERGSGRDAA